MFVLEYTTDDQAGRRQNVQDVMPLTCTITHAISEAGEVLSQHNYRLVSLRLVELRVKDNECQPKQTLLHYAREGLPEQGIT